MNPWDRQPDEPAQAYLMFCIYRSLGPMRSVEATYAAYIKDLSEKADPSDVPVEIIRTAKKYKWQERAYLYDAQKFIGVGQDLVVTLVTSVQTLAKKLLDQLLADFDKIKPKNMREFIEAINAVKDIVPPQTIEAMAVAASANRSPRKLPAPEQPGDVRALP